MAEINIYKTENINQILPKLIESIISKRTKIYILCNDSEQVKEIDYLLWSYSQLSFIPHATTSDIYQNDQMVLIGTDPNHKWRGEIIISIPSPDSKTLKSFIERYEKILFFNCELSEKPKNAVINIIEQDTTGKWIKNQL